ncbi:MAG: hypothetical protein AABZ77_05890 [Chloroflexota bacterium]
MSSWLTQISMKKKQKTSTPKGKLSWLLGIRLRNKTEETKRADETLKEAEGEAKPAAKDEAKEKTMEAKRMEAAQPPIEQKSKLAAAESALEKNIEKPVQLKQEATLPKAVESIAKRPPEKPLPEEKPEKQGATLVPQKLDSEAVYDGEIELIMAAPLDPAALSKLYSYLQVTPDMKVLYTRGSWDRGTTITVTLDKPLQFIGMISRIAGLKIAPGLPQKEERLKGTSSSLLGAKSKKLTRIDLILKAE